MVAGFCSDVCQVSGLHEGGAAGSSAGEKLLQARLGDIQQVGGDQKHMLEPQQHPGECTDVTQEDVCRGSRHANPSVVVSAEGLRAEGHSEQRFEAESSACQRTGQP